MFLKNPGKMNFKLLAFVAMTLLTAQSLSQSQLSSRCEGQEGFTSLCAPLLYNFSAYKYDGNATYWTKSVLETFAEYKDSPIACADLLSGCGFKETMTRVLEQGQDIRTCRPSYIPLLNIFKYAKACNLDFDCTYEKVVKAATQDPDMVYKLNQYKNTCKIILSKSSHKWHQLFDTKRSDDDIFMEEDGTIDLDKIAQLIGSL